MKQILTTKPHLVVLFLSVVYILIYGSSTFIVGTWDLNRTIGWGWDWTNYIWWITPHFFWFVIFPLTYWFLSKTNTFSYPLMLAHVIVIVLSMIPLFEYEISIIFSLISWLLFFANIFAAIFYTKTP